MVQILSKLIGILELKITIKIQKYARKRKGTFIFGVQKEERGENKVFTSGMQKTLKI